VSAPVLDLNRCIFGDALKVLRTLPDGVFDMCCTSPPFWGLRNYHGHGQQIGLEPTPQQCARRLVKVFREVRRVLRDDGTLWLNLGDCYAGAPGGYQGKSGQRASRTFTAKIDMRKKGGDLKPKDLVLFPAMVAQALRRDGWWLRSEIIVAKTNPQPESVIDRPTKSHEQVYVLGKRDPDEDANEHHEKLYLLAKGKQYHYDAEALSEPVSGTAHPRGHGVNPKARGAEPGTKQNPSFSSVVRHLVERRQVRDVWLIPSEPYHGAHFAVMPRELAKRCIVGGSREGGVVLDPFLGSGTVGAVAEALGRRWFGIELAPEYEQLIAKRVSQTAMYFDSPTPEQETSVEQLELEVGT
jgi:DNA modification methylase